MDSTKPCYVCGVVKPLAYFSRHAGMADGRLNKCKSCAADFTRDWSPGHRAQLRTQRTRNAGTLACVRCGAEHPRTRTFWGMTTFEYTGRPTFCRSCMAYYTSFSRGSALDSAHPFRRYARESTIRLKLRIFQTYSGLLSPRCACCGEGEFLFLTIDHIEGGGGRHRKVLGREAGRPFYHWLEMEGFPAGYQVLCCNCNFTKGYFGACPHSRPRPLQLGGVSKR